MNYLYILECLLHKRQVEQPLIKSSTNRHLIETHHIIMRSIGGTNDQTNLVNLTLREHYVMHELLVKVYQGTQYEQTAICAWNGMSRKMPKKTKSSRLYAKFRSRYNKIAGNSTRGKIAITNGQKNKYIYPNSQLPKGFHKGKTYSEQAIKNIKQGSINRTGMIIVNNKQKNKWVWPNNIPDGYTLGSLHKSNAGKIVVNNGTSQIMVYPNEIPNGYVIGSLPFSNEHRIALVNAYKNMSEETKKERNKKISQKNKGRKPWTAGKHLSDEHKMAISRGNQNKKISAEQKRQISNRQRGKIKVNNGIKTIYADPNNIPKGYVKGQLHKDYEAYKNNMAAGQKRRWSKTTKV